MPLKFNPFTGSFDYVTDVSTLAGRVPLAVDAPDVFTVPANSQLPYGQEIDLSGGGDIDLDGVLYWAWA